MQDSVMGDVPVFADLLRALRRDAGLTQEQLAERTSLSVEGISALERGQRTHPRRSTLNLLADGLGVSPQDRERLVAAAQGADAGGGSSSSSSAETGAAAAGSITVTLGVPHQLPAPAGPLIGRDLEIARLQRALRSGARAVAITGMGGVGKSALAIEVATKLAPSFGGGQVFLDMRGHQPNPSRTGLEAVRYVVESFGVPSEQVPKDADAAVALFRSMTAQRRVLIVLDDLDPQMSIDLLVPCGECALIVTGRATPPGGLDVLQVPLAALSQDAARHLLGSMVGSERLSAEGEATGTLIRTCAGLPLALRIVGTRLQRRPAWPVQFLADRMGTHADRLSELQLGDIAVRRTVAATYDHLSNAGDEGEALADVLAVIGLLDSSSVSVVAAAALADLTLPRARALLEQLADASLLDSVGPSHFRVHDLVHDFTAELAAGRFSNEQVDAAQGRRMRAYTSLAWTARALVRPAVAGFKSENLQQDWPHSMSAEECLDALAVDIDHVVRLIETALTSADPEDRRQGVLLTLGVSAYCMTRSTSIDWAAIVNRSLHTDAAQEPHLRAMLLLDHSMALTGAGRQAESLLAAKEAIVLADDIGCDGLRASAHLSASLAARRLGETETAREHTMRAQELSQAAGDARTEAASWRDLGLQLQDVGRLDDAIVAERRALRMYEDIGIERGRCMALINVGVMERERGEQAAAFSLLEDAVRSARLCGDRELEVEALDELGGWHLRFGDLDQCLELLRAGLELLDQRGERQWEAGIRYRLASALVELGRYEDAFDQWQVAIEVCERRGEHAAAAQLAQQRDAALGARVSTSTVVPRG